MQNLSFVSIDLETTGLDETAEIIEIGMVKVKNGQIIDRFSQLVKPIQPIPEQVRLITGIDDSMVVNQPIWSHIENEVLAFIGQELLVAHNVNFDKNMLEHHLGYELSNQWIDTHDLAKILLPSIPSYKLVSIANHLKIEGSGYHRASNDAEVCALILIDLVQKLEQTPINILNKIVEIFHEDNCGLTTILKTTLSELVAMFEVGNRLEADKVNPVISTRKRPNLTFATADHFFEPNGIMAQKNPDYQYRPQQIGMLNTIRNGFLSEQHAIVEAGTGTGKSFAYLIPSLLWALEKDTKIVVSTNTIALQEQLFKKDIPFLKSCLEYDFPVAISKGRSNYLCLRRYDLYKSQKQSLYWSEKIFAAQILYWSSSTLLGDREELNLNKYENQLWGNLSSQAETCLNSKCPYCTRCYYFKNKKQCEQSILIITNHALLLQDLKLDNKVLPSYQYVIVDEAHNLEDETTKQFTRTLDLNYLGKISQQILRSNGVLSRILTRLGNDPNFADIKDILDKTYQQFMEDAFLLDQNIKSLTEFVSYQPFLANVGEKRILSTDRQASWWSELETKLTKIIGIITSIEKKLNKFLLQIELLEELEHLERELSFTHKWYGEMRELTTDFIGEENENSVYWLEYISNSWGNNLYLSIAPINVSGLLKERLFDANKSVVLTSATLAVSNNLKYTAQSYNLTEGEYLTYITKSPFDYSKQSLIAIPTDCLNFSQVNEQAYSSMVLENLKQIITSVTGGILVLFTSYSMLNNVYYQLKNCSNLAEYNILAHGHDGTRTSLIESLSKKERTVVLGASSFWEGVDVKGKGLTTVVIVKLPFIPPTRPITSARIEYIEKKGKNSFSHYSLPQAVLKFRQGYGRLIRSNNDWGALIILDSRVVTKTYGKQFINSLPKQPVIKGSLSEVCTHLNKWMTERSKTIHAD